MEIDFTITLNWPLVMVDYFARNFTGQYFTGHFLLYRNFTGPYFTGCFIIRYQLLIKLEIIL